MTTENDDLLEQHFAALREQAPMPSGDLMARILADAHQVQDRFATHTPRPSVFAQILDVIGGWPSVTGLATATVAGVWLGISPPDMMTTLAEPIFGETAALDFDLGDDPFDLGDPS